MGGLIRRSLDGCNLTGDLVRRLRGLARQGFHLRRHDRETTAGFAGPRGLNGGVQGEEVGLFRDGPDETHDGADALRGIGELPHLLVGGGRLAKGCVDLGLGDIEAGADLNDRSGEFLGGACDGLHVGGSLARAGRGALHRTGGVRRRVRHGGGAGTKLARLRADQADRFCDLGSETGDLRIDDRTALFNVFGTRHPLCLQFARLQAGFAQRLERTGHGTDFVPCVAIGNRTLEIPCHEVRGPLREHANGTKHAERCKAQDETGQNGHGQDRPAQGREGLRLDGVIGFEGYAHEQDAVDPTLRILHRLIDCEIPAAEKSCRPEICLAASNE